LGINSSSGGTGFDGSLRTTTMKRGRSPTPCGMLNMELSLKKSKTINDLSVFSTVCEMYAMVDGVDDDLHCALSLAGGGGGAAAGATSGARGSGTGSDDGSGSGGGEGIDGTRCRRLSIEAQPSADATSGSEVDEDTDDGDVRGGPGGAAACSHRCGKDGSSSSGGDGGGAGRPPEKAPEF
jgi:hypothetical protein